jgi:type II secretory pathway component GspD/PulD (secretin)
MKKTLTALLLGLATSGLVSFAQDNPAPNPAPPGPPPADTAPAAPPTDAPPPPATPPVNAPSPQPAPPAPAPAPEAPPPAAPPPANLVDTGAPTPPTAAPADNTTAAAQAATNNAAAPAAPKADEIVPLIVIDDVPLTDAIRNLARQSSLNFQFDPRVTSTNQPNVSIRFENVTAQEALNAVLENYGLVLVRDPKSKIARITIKDPKAEEPLVSRIVQLKYSDPTNLVSVLKQSMSARSSVVADPRTSQLIINTTEKELDNVLNLITKLDLATRQVLIEARLLETSRNPSTIKGIDWAGTVEAQRLAFGNNLQTKPVDSKESDNKVLSTQWPRLLVDTAKGFNPATAFLDADGVSAVFSFLNKDAETEVVATPRAVTLDNQTAQLSITRAFPIFQVTPGSANSPAGASVTYTNLGTILSVTPRIAADNNISLKVVPEVSNIDSVDRQTLNGSVNTANIYAIRRIETSVMIPSGNTLVMGGLINDTKTESYNKVPVLGDIPLVGQYAFAHKSKTRLKSNLLIFLTPTIVEDGDYHPSSAGREFMQTRVIEKPEPKETAWDSAKPHDWTKPLGH